MYLCFIFPLATVAYIHFKAAEAGMRDMPWLKQELRAWWQRAVVERFARTRLGARRRRGAHKRTRSDVEVSRQRHA